MTAPREARKHMSSQDLGPFLALILAAGAALAQTPPVAPAHAALAPGSQCARRRDSSASC